MNQFYVVLPSDSSIDFFSDNTVAHYKTKLAHPICTDGDYEVALTELIYPMRYYNFIPPNKVSLRYSLGESDNFNWELQPGYFRDEESLVDYLNASLLKTFSTHYKGDPFFKYDEKKKRLRFRMYGTLTKDGVAHSVDFNAREAGMSLGLIEKLKLGKNEVFELSDYQSLIYVYCDIVSPSLIGDVQTPLLRVIALTGE